MKNEFMNVPIFTGEGKVHFEERKIPTPGDNQLLIQAKANLLCGFSHTKISHSEVKTKIKAVMLDMDGVLRRGFEAIKGSNSLISWMSSKSIPGMIVTNECRYTEDELRLDLKKMGISYPASMPIYTSAMAMRDFFKEKIEVLPRILPFLAIIAGVLYVLYGGVATPSEASGVGAFLVFVLIAVVYKIYQPKKIWNIVKVSMKESVMIMFIIAASYLFAFTLSQLYVTQSLAQSMVEMSSNKWVVFILINIFLLIAGFFLPPVAVIVMTSAILLPVITQLGFDPYWFAIVFTINMEIGLITPPVGLNLYIIKGITPDVSLSEILKGSIPFMIIMALAILILCIFPEIVTWLPDKIMGKSLGF